MGDHEAPSTTLGVSLKNNTYDTFKWLVQIVLPAVGAFYFLLGEIWGLPAVTEVVGTLAGLAIFLGTIMGLSKKAYDTDAGKHDGAMVPDFTEDGQPIARVELNPALDGESLVAKKNLTIKGLTPEGVELLRSQGLSEPS